MVNNMSIYGHTYHKVTCPYKVNNMSIPQWGHQWGSQWGSQWGHQCGHQCGHQWGHQCGPKWGHR